MQRSRLATRTAAGSVAALLAFGLAACEAQAGGEIDPGEEGGAEVEGEADLGGEGEG